MSLPTALITSTHWPQDSWRYSRVTHTGVIWEGVLFWLVADWAADWPLTSIRRRLRPVGSTASCASPFTTPISPRSIQLLHLPPL